MFPKERLLPFIEELSRRAHFAEIVPLSALKGSNIEQLPALIARHLPESPPHFPADQVTDRIGRSSRRRRSCARS